MSIRSLIALILFTLLSFKSLAMVEVGFFAKFDKRTGERISFDENGRFYHVAFRVNGQWLSANSYFNVYLTQSFPELVHEESVILKNEYISANDINACSNQTFDLLSDWDDNTTTYCSKLIGKLLNVKPTPMSFSRKEFEKFDTPKGSFGLTPDELYEKLIARTNSCSYRLR